MLDAFGLDSAQLLHNALLPVITSALLWLAVPLRSSVRLLGGAGWADVSTTYVSFCPMLPPRLLLLLLIVRDESSCTLQCAPLFCFSWKRGLGAIKPHYGLVTVTMP